MSYPGKIRIIGGRWRHRYIAVPPLLARPTPNRVRETLFNWLAPIIEGTDVLDLFAGSGALGFEALSRGAAHVTFVDASQTVLNILKNTAEVLRADVGSVSFINGQFPNHMPPLSKQYYDIIFLDPPFHKGLIAQTILWLEQQNLVKSGSHVYLEMESNTPLPDLSSAWQKHKMKIAGDVVYYLLKYES